MLRNTNLGTYLTDPANLKPIVAHISVFTVCASPFSIVALILVYLRFARNLTARISQVGKRLAMCLGLWNIVTRKTFILVKHTTKQRRWLGFGLAEKGNYTLFQP